jgi:hypothetical protein
VFDFIYSAKNSPKTVKVYFCYRILNHVMPDTTPCPFCSLDTNVIVANNDFWYAQWDTYPISQGLLLVIPFRHVQNCFAITQDERK